MTPEQSAAAAVTAINAKFSTTRAYELDDVPATRPDYYVEVAVSRRLVSGNRRGDGSKSFKGYRLTTRVVALTITNARLLEQKVTEALDFVALGSDVTPVEYETSTSVDPDDGWFSGVTSWTFSA